MGIKPVHPIIETRLGQQLINFDLLIRSRESKTCEKRVYEDLCCRGNQ